ncbi:CAP domain-containing protein [Streptomyces sp. NPDC091279]|uniref:CAP domain-containing protein n=1 Tax=unclassified Streptomyces TaxID=2593676 RepID=UPI00380F85FC
MGRHRRSAAGRAATGRATGGTTPHGSYTGGHTPLDSNDFAHDASGGAGVQGSRGARPLTEDGQADASARSAAYLFATEDDFRTVFPADGFTPDGGGPDGGSSRRRRKKRIATPVRTGLLGVSAAVALGTVAVASGAVPGLHDYRLGGGGSGDTAQAAAGSPSNSASEQGGTSGSAASRGAGTSTSRDAERAESPSPTPSTASPAPSTKAPEKKKPTATPSRKPVPTPSQRETEQQPTATPTEAAVSTEAAAEAEVLHLVNEERAKVGCSALAANSALGGLARDFSTAMAEQGFFDHTDPSGASPWDRAAKAGITNLGGENIARGQSDPAAVMDAWMNSPGHRANILNCDFKTLGVGVHFGSGGPWWTQDFGY